MSKFKVGDKVRAVSQSYGWGAVSKGDIGVVAEVKKDRYYVDFPNQICWTGEASNLELIKGEQTMGRRTFRVVKETPTLNKGALVQEMCDDGDQDYQTLEDNRFGRKVVYSRDVVESQSKFFEEVFPLVPEYGNKAELETFKKFSKKRK